MPDVSTLVSREMSTWKLFSMAFVGVLIRTGMSSVVPDCTNWKPVVCPRSKSLSSMARLALTDLLTWLAAASGQASAVRETTW